MQYFIGLVLFALGASYGHGANLFFTIMGGGLMIAAIINAVCNTIIKSKGNKNV